MATTEYEGLSGNLRAEWMKGRLLEAQTLVRKGACSALDRLAEEVVQRFSDGQGTMEELQGSCRKRQELLRLQEQEKQQAEEKQQELEEQQKQLDDELRGVLRQGRTAEAFRLCRSAPELLSLDMLSLCTIAACKVHNEAAAKAFFRRLPAKRQGSVIQGCMLQDIELVPDQP